MILDRFNPSRAALVRDDIGREIGDEPEFTTPEGRRMTRRCKIVPRDHANQVNQVGLIYYLTPRRAGKSVCGRRFRRAICSASRLRNCWRAAALPWNLFMSIMTRVLAVRGIPVH